MATRDEDERQRQEVVRWMNEMLPPFNDMIRQWAAEHSKPTVPASKVAPLPKRPRTKTRRTPKQKRQ